MKPLTAEEYYILTLPPEAGCDASCLETFPQPPDAYELAITLVERGLLEMIDCKVAPERFVHARVTALGETAKRAYEALTKGVVT